MSAGNHNPSPTQDRIKAKLLSRENHRRYLAIAGIIAGLPLLLPAPFIFASVAWYVIRTWAPQPIAFNTVLLVTAVIIVPLSFLTELRTRGGFLNHAYAEASSDFALSAATLIMLRPLSIGIGPNPRLSTAGIAELMLIGPRWVLGGIRGLRLDWRMRKLDRDRPAKMLADLLALSSGTDPKKLAQPGETMDQLDATLAYLVTFGWVGLTVTMDRVYVYSESRETLTEPPAKQTVSSS